MTKFEKDYYKEYNERFSTYSDLEIIAAFNKQVGNTGWGTARAAYLSAIRDEFDRRNIDISNIKNGNTTSFAKKVTLYDLDNKKFIKPID